MDRYLCFKAYPKHHKMCNLFRDPFGNLLLMYALPVGNRLLSEVRTKTKNLYCPDFGNPMIPFDGYFYCGICGFRNAAMNSCIQIDTRLIGVHRQHLFSACRYLGFNRRDNIHWVGGHSAPFRWAFRYFYGVPCQFLTV